MMHGVLDEDGNVIEASFMEWARWLGKSGPQRVIEQTVLDGDIQVSTVFLGLNHQWTPGRPAQWFETMVFGPPVTEYTEILHREWTHRPALDYCERYTTRAQALEGHLKAIAWANERT